MRPLSYVVVRNAYVPPIQQGASFRHLPYDSLAPAGPVGGYYDWLVAVSWNLRQLIPEYFQHAVDVRSDTVGTMEAFVLAALAKIPISNTELIRRLSTSDVFVNAARFAALAHPDLRAYFLYGVWPATAKPRYAVVTAEDDRQVLRGMAQIRRQLVERANAELSVEVPDGEPTATAPAADLYTPAIQDSMLLALIARLRYKYNVLVDTSAPSIADHVATIFAWRKRFLLSPELLYALQPRPRFSSRKNTLVPIRPIVAQQFSLPSSNEPSILWMPIATGEARNPRSNQFYLPPQPQLQQQVEFYPQMALPAGARVSPAAALTNLPPSGSIYQLIHSYSSFRNYDPYGRTYSYAAGPPMVMPRPAYVENDTATLLGGKAKRK